MTPKKVHHQNFIEEESGPQMFQQIINRRGITALDVVTIDDLGAGGDRNTLARMATDDKITLTINEQQPPHA